MKTLYALAAVALFAVTANAQTPSTRGVKLPQGWARLDLTAVQKARIKIIQQDTSAKRKELSTKYAAAREALQQAEYEMMVKELTEEQKKALAKLVTEPADNPTKK